MRHRKTLRRAARGTRQPRPLVRGPRLRLAVERLPRPTKAPTPRWLWWHGPTPPDGAEVGPAYPARFASEHPFRVFKHTLRGTTPNLRSPSAADRWTWLVMLADPPLRLARDAVVEGRFPGQAPLPPERRTPARVRRGFAPLLPHLGRPASVPKPGGRSPGRPKGKRSLSSCQTFPGRQIAALIRHYRLRTAAVRPRAGTCLTCRPPAVG